MSTTYLTRDQKTVLKYLLSLERDGENTVELRKKNYNDIQKITPERFVQVLTELEGTFLKLNFLGDKSPQSFCYVKLNAPAITYFKEKNHNRLASFAFTTKEVVIAIISAIIGAAVGSIITYLLTTKL